MRISRLLLLFTLGVMTFSSCSSPSETKDKRDKKENQKEAPEKTDIQLEGDFDGDGKSEVIYLTVIPGEGNPAENGRPARYYLNCDVFDDEPLLLGCCEAILLNEGDLNGSGKDFISVIKAPNHGSLYSHKIYHYVPKQGWDGVCESEMRPYANGIPNETELQNLVYLEADRAYIRVHDMNDEDMGFARSRPLDFCNPGLFKSQAP